MVTSIIPMASAKVDADKLTAYWENPDWIAEKKYDGSRYLMYAGFGEGEYKNIFRSRQTSKKTGQTVEKTENVPHLSKQVFSLSDGTVPKIIFDGEIIVSETATSNEVTSIMGALPDKAIQRQEERGLVKYVVFDILEIDGEDVTAKPWHERRNLLHKMYINLFATNPNIYLSEVVRVNKESFYHEFVQSGGEGVMLKNMNAPYIKVSIGEREYRNKNVWIKVKKYSTYDVVVTGFTEPTKEYTGKHPETWTYWTSLIDGSLFNGTEDQLPREPYVRVTRDYYHNWIGAVKFSQYNDDGKLVEIGQTDGMSDADKEFFTKNKEILLGKVIEVGAMEQSKSTAALRHPRFLRMREDKNPEQCVLWVN